MYSSSSSPYFFLPFCLLTKLCWHLNVVSLQSRSPARLLVGVVYEEGDEETASQSISACCHLQKRTIDSLLLIFLSAVVFHCCYFAGKRKYNRVCDSPRFSLLYFGSCLFLSRSFILFLSPVSAFLLWHLNLPLWTPHSLCLSPSPSCCLLIVQTHVYGGTFWGPGYTGGRWFVWTDLDAEAWPFLVFHLVCFWASLIL